MLGQRPAERRGVVHLLLDALVEELLDKPVDRLPLWRRDPARDHRRGNAGSGIELALRRAHGVREVDVPVGDLRRARVQERERDVLLPALAVQVVLVAHPICRRVRGTTEARLELLRDSRHVGDAHERGALEVREDPGHPEVGHELAGISDGRHVHLALVVAADRRLEARWRREPDEVLDREPLDRDARRRVADARLEERGTDPLGQPLDAGLVIPAVGREEGERDPVLRRRIDDGQREEPQRDLINRRRRGATAAVSATGTAGLGRAVGGGRRRRGLRRVARGNHDDDYEGQSGSPCKAGAWALQHTHGPEHVTRRWPLRDALPAVRRPMRSWAGLLGLRLCAPRCTGRLWRPDRRRHALPLLHRGEATEVVAPARDRRPGA